MANPNIVAVTEIYGKLAFQAVSQTATPIVSNGASSNKLLKINSLVISNVDGVNAATLTVDILRNSVATHVIKGVSISPNTAFTAIDKGVVIYLEEGDELRLSAGTNNDLEAVCSYEEII
jgi:acetamidase/formamidase